MATFLELTDTPVNYTGDAGKYLQVDGSEGNVILNVINLTDLNDTNLPAPGTGQVLTWSAGSSKWIAQDNNPYSAGNGINFGGSGQVINVVAGSSGGLTSNTNGIYITDTGVTAGTYGNATYVPAVTVNSKGQITSVTATEITLTAADSLTADYVEKVSGTAGQITVTGGTGNKSTATLNLVATGVTAGVYGNTTHAPRITVDTYGRISSVDAVELQGSGSGGNASLGFSNIHVTGQTSIGAETLEDDLTISSGTGMSITTDANNDIISFGINPTSAAQAMSILNLSDVNAGSISNGQVLVWNNSTSKFEPGAGGGGGGAADQTLSASGNVITISGSNDTVDLTTMLGSVAAGATGATGPQGPAGSTGPQGATGPAGAGTSGIGSATISGVDLILTLNDSTTVNAGNVKGPAGPQGVAGPTGSTGATGPAGAAGDVDQTLSLNANILTISGSASTVDLAKTQFLYANQNDFPNASTYHGAIAHSHADGAMYFAHGGAWVKLQSGTDADAQDLTLSGNVISLTGQSGNVDLTTALAGSGGGATTLNGLTDVSTSGVSSGQVLKYNGTSWAPAADLNSGGGGGGGATVQRFKLNYLSSGNLDDTSDKTSLINSITVDSATGGDCTVTFDSSVNYPPASIMVYGYDYTNNKYYAVPLETTMGLREIAGGGSSGSPTLFNGSSNISLKLRLREAETGASRGGFGTTTHAWIEFVVYD